MRTSHAEDAVLDVEASDIDCLYRIAHNTSIVKRVVYVTITDASIIPEAERTESSLILRNLRRLPGWHDHDWHTMNVLKTESGVYTELDRTAPQALSSDMLLADLPRYDYFQCQDSQPAQAGDSTGPPRRARRLHENSPVPLPAQLPQARGDDVPTPAA